MVRVALDTSLFRRFHRTSLEVRRTGSRRNLTIPLRSFAVVGGAVLVGGIIFMHNRYTLSLQSPLHLHFQSPVVVSRRAEPKQVVHAQADQQSSLTAYQQYTCRKFGPDCRIALAIQRVENPQGKCEVYHYNPDGTLDWGYFQINTVHLKRRGVNLRDLLDCKANIDFAYRLYQEAHGFTAWSTFKNGTYRRALGEQKLEPSITGQSRSPAPTS